MRDLLGSSNDLEGLRQGVWIGRLTARIGDERAQQGRAVDLVGLGAPMSPRHRNRGRINDVARKAVLTKQPVQPEAVEPSFGDDGDRHRCAEALRDRCRSSSWRSAAASPPGTLYLENLALPGALTVTSQRDLLSSSETKSVLAWDWTVTGVFAR